MPHWKRAYQLAQSVGAKGVICDNYEYAAWVYSAIGDYQTAYEKQTSLYALSKEIQSENKLRTVEQRIAQENVIGSTTKRKNYVSRNIR